MKTYKRTLTSTETHEVLSIRINFGSQAETTARWCEVCASETAAIPTEVAAVFAGGTEASLQRLVRNGLMHFQEPIDGQPLVCLGNLAGARPQTHTETENHPHTHGGNFHDHD